MEIIWTGLNSLMKKDYKLIATTSIWMFFIYGAAVFMEPVCDTVGGLPVICRGGLYVICIFCIEFITGGIMKKLNACPWDYSGSRYNVRGLIRLDYAPVWFVAGIIFEMLYRRLLI